MDRLCTAEARAFPAPSKSQYPVPRWSPQPRIRWSQVNEQGSGKATRNQVAGLWIAACSQALALLRTVFDVLEVMGR